MYACVCVVQTENVSMFHFLYMNLSFSTDVLFLLIVMLEAVFCCCFSYALVHFA